MFAPRSNIGVLTGTNQKIETGIINGIVDTIGVWRVENVANSNIERATGCSAASGWRVKPGADGHGISGSDEC